MRSTILLVTLFVIISTLFSHSNGQKGCVKLPSGKNSTMPQMNSVCFVVPVSSGSSGATTFNYNIDIDSNDFYGIYVGTTTSKNNKCNNNNFNPIDKGLGPGHVNVNSTSEPLPKGSRAAYMIACDNQTQPCNIEIVGGTVCYQ
ncbi:hypothetical protein DFA_06254 [Cavenderia fasciculata]|uniref:Carbohydrate binding domain-containing protein n=1 Tax=Cavenderia fasciculata TaxID=261658 RepID=F4PKJ1_CACFS|nr:uncharacterized protein DFA_06254 [Cavenderia fasciculata]EGG24115.1 hypothetical protein DFA_06254 [Cavenderia fasciculata]|eukprot:XP_004361966.1 hypothetical protein DFA_06254 [Cavenderia fasciculata]